MLRLFTMRTALSILMATMLALACLTNIGCNGSDAPTTASTDAAAHEATHADVPQEAQAEAAEPAPVEGNVITRNFPRYHDAFESDRAFLQWRNTFYQHKQFDRLPEAIGYYCASDLYHDETGRVPMAAFFGAALAQSNAAIDDCYDELMLEGRDSELITLGYSIWHADTPHARQMIIQATEIWQTEKLVRLLSTLARTKKQRTIDRAFEDSRVMYMLSSEFFANGDEATLRKIISVAHMHNAPEDTWQRFAGQGATLVLRGLLPDHPMVRRIVEDEAANNPSTPVRTHMNILLKEAGPPKERPGIDNPAGN